MPVPNFSQLPQLIQDPILKESGVVTPTELNLPDNINADQWKQIGLELGRFGSAHQWWIGDWWAFGQHKWGDRKKIVEAEDWTGPAYQTCFNASNVSKKFESNRRRLSLPFSHHAEVASVNNAIEADELLDWCETPLKNGRKRPRSISELREQVKKVKAYLAQGWNASQLERKAQVEQGLSVLASNQLGANGLSVDNALITWADSQGLLVPIDRTSDWGNPFIVDEDGTREECIEWYAEYFAHKRSLHRRWAELAKGKVLLCWCHPQPCHGDFLLKQLDTLQAKSRYDN